MLAGKAAGKKLKEAKIELLLKIEKQVKLLAKYQSRLQAHEEHGRELKSKNAYLELRANKLQELLLANEVKTENLKD